MFISRRILLRLTVSLMHNLIGFVQTGMCIRKDVSAQAAEHFLEQERNESEFRILTHLPQCILLTPSETLKGRCLTSTIELWEKLFLMASFMASENDRERNKTL